MSLVLDEATQARQAVVEAAEASADAARLQAAGANRPDAVVKEETGRKAIGRLVEGLAKQAQSIGMLPKTELATKWSTGIVEEQIKRHEESFAKSASTSVEASPAQLDRGIDGASVINRRVGTAVLGAPGAGAAPVGEFGRPAKPQDPLLKRRVDALLAMPEWNAKVMKAFEQGMAKHGDQSRACDDVMAIVEQSNALFGDWRCPPHLGQRIYVGGV